MLNISIQYHPYQYDCFHRIVVLRLILMNALFLSAFILNHQDTFFPKKHHILDSATTTKKRRMSVSKDDESIISSCLWEEKYNIYKQSMRDVLQSSRVSRRETDEDLQVVSKILLDTSSIPYFPIDWIDDYTLMMNETNIEPSSSSATTTVTNRNHSYSLSSSRKHTFMNNLKSQRDLYINITGIQPNQYKLAVKALNYLGDSCAKKNFPYPLHYGWMKVRELGAILQENALSTYLYVLSSSTKTTTTTNAYISTRTTTIHEENVPSSQETDDLLSEIATFHDLLYEPCEKTITLRIKSYIHRGDVQKAEILLDTLPKMGGDLRLRTCVPILEQYCRYKPDMAAALKLYKKMRSSSTVLLEPEIFAMILSSLATQGYFQPNATMIEGALELGYSQGPSLLDEILGDMAEDVVEITNIAATEIRNGFVEGFQGWTMADTLHRVPWDCQLYPVNYPAVSDELVACRVTVDEKTGFCPRSQTRLKLMVLSDEDRRRMFDVLLNMAEAQFESYDLKLEAKNQRSKVDVLEGDFARNELKKFASWLDEREGDPFTAIVDGANVAYFGSGSINYLQLQLMVSTLEKMGETPLVVMPQKYVQEKFYIRKKFIQVLNQNDMGIINDLSAKGSLYVVPQRCLDDYYWVLSSLSNQTRSRKDRDLNILPNDPKGRWPGIRPFLITNDLMRDHKLELLQPRLFRRWFSSHIVNYGIFLNDSESDNREITFTTADFFSREIQSNPTDNGTVWHFPVRDWDRNDRFCLRIPDRP